MRQGSERCCHRCGSSRQLTRLPSGSQPSPCPDLRGRAATATRNLSLSSFSFEDLPAARSLAPGLACHWLSQHSPGWTQMG